MAQVGGQRVDEVLPLGVSGIVELREIVGEAYELLRAQTLHQAVVDHVLLRVVERDAHALADQATHALEVARRVVELARGESFARTRDFRQRRAHSAAAASSASAMSRLDISTSMSIRISIWPPIVVRPCR